MAKHKDKTTKAVHTESKSYNYQNRARQKKQSKHYNKYINLNGDNKKERGIKSIKQNIEEALTFLRSNKIFIFLFIWKTPSQNLLLVKQDYQK